MLLSQTNKSRLSPEEWRREERETGSVSFTLRQSKLKVYVLVRPPIDLRLCIYIWWMSDTQSHGIPGIKTKVLFRREKNGGSGATWRSLGGQPRRRLFRRDVSNYLPNIDGRSMFCR